MLKSLGHHFKIIENGLTHAFGCGPAVWCGVVGGGGMRFLSTYRDSKKNSHSKHQNMQGPLPWMFFCPPAGVKVYGIERSSCRLHKAPSFCFFFFFFFFCLCVCVSVVHEGLYFLFLF